MSTNFTTCYIDSDGNDVSQEFVEKSYLLDVYGSLINPAKAPSLWVWGCNSVGQLGDNTAVVKSSPVQTVSAGTNWKQVSVGSFNLAGIKTDGTLWIWGCGAAIGDNTIVNKSSPVQTVSGGTNWKQVSVGSCRAGAIKTDGTLWLWGSGGLGMMGTNSIINRSSPVQTVSGGTNWKQVSVGSCTVGAIKTDGTLWMWGTGTYGALGTNDATTRSSPVQTVSGGTNWKQVSVAKTTGSTNHTAAIKTDGTLWTWGCNGSSQLGINTSAGCRSSPVQTISGGTDWKQVSVGEAFTAAIKTDGTLWLWGCGAGGALGNNSTTNRSSPVQTVSGGTNWKYVDAGSYHVLAIKTDGSLWVWGCNRIGNLGVNDINDACSPRQLASEHNWKQISAGMSVSLGETSSMAIREEGDW